MATKPKTVIDLLSEQPEDELLKMRDVNRQEVARAQEELSRLQVEGRQIEQALRRGRIGSGSGRITREQVYEAASRVEPPMTAAEVKEALAVEGFETSINAIRNHLNRLVDRGQLERDEDGRYVVLAATPASDFGPPPADDDIPF